MMIDFARCEEREHATPAAKRSPKLLHPLRRSTTTTMAALTGAFPTVSAGRGGSGRQPLGLAVVGGLSLAGATLYITPVIYGEASIRSGVKLDPRDQPVTLRRRGRSRAR